MVADASLNGPVGQDLVALQHASHGFGNVGVRHGRAGVVNGEVLGDGRHTHDTEGGAPCGDPLGVAADGSCERHGMIVHADAYVGRFNVGVHRSSASTAYWICRALSVSVIMTGVLSASGDGNFGRFLR
ncbi:hypothetical protein NHF46_07870 [Arthrobacter alpinus]|nr:hypothetical protein [Arthrobacter alpinus]